MTLWATLPPLAYKLGFILHASAHGRLFGCLTMLRLERVVGTMHHSARGVVHGFMTMFLMMFVVFGVNLATFCELQTD
jgi:hypothetical protein